MELFKGLFWVKLNFSACQLIFQNFQHNKAVSDSPDCAVTHLHGLLPVALLSPGAHPSLHPGWRHSGTEEKRRPFPVLLCPFHVSIRSLSNFTSPQLPHPSGNSRRLMPWLRPIRREA